MIQFAFILFLGALLTAPAVTLAGRRWRGANSASAWLLLGALITGLVLASLGFWRGTQAGIDLTGVASFSFALSMDRLSAFFLLLICCTALPVVLFSKTYVDRHYEGAKRTWIWTLLPLFLLSMILVVTASTAFAFLFGWELMTLFSGALILVDGDSERRRHNVFIYLLMMHAGAAAVIAAFLVFLPHSGSLDFVHMRAAVAGMPGAVRNTIFVLALIGFGTKAGIVPLHLWLPKAHPIAPSPVSALMSGVMLKTAVYGLLRFGFDFLGTGPAWWGYAVLVAGALSGLLGALYALAERDLKRLLAYSSVENIGIICLGLGAAMVFRTHGVRAWAAVALVAALLHCLNHAIFKSLLFLGAGAVADATHSLNMDTLGGLLNRMRITGKLMLVACCAIAGLPLFSGFVGEWLLFRAFLAGSSLSTFSGAILLPLSTGVLALIAGLGAACFANLYSVTFLGRPRSEEAAGASEVPRTMRVALAVLAAGCIVPGIAPGLLMRPLGNLAEDLVAAPLPVEVWSLARVLPWIALGLAVVLAAAAIIRRMTRVTPTWACGMPVLDTRMQYTSTAFAKPLRKAFSQVYKADRTLEFLPVDRPLFPAAISYRSVRTTSFEKSLYKPAVDAIVRAALRLRRLQTGNIQVYLLYIFAALILLLIFTRWA